MNAPRYGFYFCPTSVLEENAYLAAGPRLLKTFSWFPFLYPEMWRVFRRAKGSVGINPRAALRRSPIRVSPGDAMGVQSLLLEGVAREISARWFHDAAAVGFFSGGVHMAFAYAGVFAHSLAAIHTSAPLQAILKDAFRIGLKRDICQSLLLGPPETLASADFLSWLGDATQDLAVAVKDWRLPRAVLVAGPRPDLDMFIARLRRMWPRLRSTLPVWTNAAHLPLLRAADRDKDLEHVHFHSPSVPLVLADGGVLDAGEQDTARIKQCYTDAISAPMHSGRAINRLMDMCDTVIVIGTRETFRALRWLDRGTWRRLVLLAPQQHLEHHVWRCFTWRHCPEHRIPLPPGARKTDPEHTRGQHGTQSRP